jgi:hypothetical protein
MSTKVRDCKACNALRRLTNAPANFRLLRAMWAAGFNNSTAHKASHSRPKPHMAMSSTSTPVSRPPLIS